MCHYLTGTVVFQVIGEGKQVRQFVGDAKPYPVLIVRAVKSYYVLTIPLS